MIGALSLQSPFIRRVTLEVSDIPEWEGGIYKKKTIKITSNGNEKSLRVSFIIQKDIMGTPNQAIITVYNSEELRRLAKKRGMSVVLGVGWENIGTQDVFTGGIMAAVTKKVGCDYVTTIHCITGFGLLMSMFTGNFGANRDVSGVVSDIAKTLPGVSVSNSNIDIDGKLGASGLSYAGQSNQLLSQLANTHNFSYGVHDNNFIAVSDKRGTSEVIKITPDSGIVSVEPILMAPMQIQTGISVVTFLNPKIKIFSMVEVVSEVNSSYSGRYKVHSLEHRGDTHAGDQWLTSIKSITLGQAQSILAFTGVF